MYSAIYISALNYKPCNASFIRTKQVSQSIHSLTITRMPNQSPKCKEYSRGHKTSLVNRLRKSSLAPTSFTKYKVHIVFIDTQNIPN